MTDKPTCGELYKAAFDKYTGGDPAKARLFAAGFVGGQAEKCFSGACRACMFRPSDEWREMVLEVVEGAAERYGLIVFPFVGSRREIWVCRAEWWDRVNELCSGELIEDSPAWHHHRAYLCGIPDAEVDTRYHLLAGHEKRCD